MKTKKIRNWMLGIIGFLLLFWIFMIIVSWEDYDEVVTTPERLNTDTQIPNKNPGNFVVQVPYGMSLDLAQEAMRRKAQRTGVNYESYKNQDGFNVLIARDLNHGRVILSVAFVHNNEVVGSGEITVERATGKLDDWYAYGLAQMVFESERMFNSEAPGESRGDNYLRRLWRIPGYGGIVQNYRDNYVVETIAMSCIDVYFEPLWAVLTGLAENIY